MLLPELVLIILIREATIQGVGVVKFFEETAGGFRTVIEILARGVATVVGMVADIVIDGDIVKLPSDIAPLRNPLVTMGTVDRCHQAAWG
jgi:hypothetical protein